MALLVAGKDLASVLPPGYPVSVGKKTDQGDT